MSKTVMIKLEIDCDPFSRRQDILGRECFSIAGQSYRDADFKFYGLWGWHNLKVTTEQREQIANLLRDAYINGQCRYVGWTIEEL